MKSISNFWVFLTLITVITISSCTDDLNTDPVVERRLEDLLNEDPDAVKGLVARLYGGLILHGTGVPGSGNQQSDVVADDPGEAVYLRSLWNLQEMTTDIVKNRWGDGGLDPLTTTSNWVATNKYFGYMYNRIFFQISQVNNFLLETEAIDFQEKDELRAEARFLRALSYYHAMDLFGGVPLVTEKDGIGGALKPRSTRGQIFEYVEEELIQIREIIPVQNEYGRANRSAVDMVLAKIYLNAEVYANTSMYDKALEFCDIIINEGGFSLDENYQSIFQGDNFNSKEIIFPIVSDRVNIQSFGGTTYLVNGSYSTDTMNVREDPDDPESKLLYSIADLGAQAGWTGHRCTPALYSLFEGISEDSFDTSTDDSDTNEDQRAIFFTAGHNFEMNDYRSWKDGYPTTKFRNTYAAGDAPSMNFSDIDFPMFRLADVYLMYAEAHLEGGGGSESRAISLINELRERAYGGPSGNIDAATFRSPDFIRDERARELYYEGHRRQDLIRLGQFTGGTYTWPWKGGIVTGAAIPSTYALFPIPLEALQANPNFGGQNQGY